MPTPSANPEDDPEAITAARNTAGPKPPEMPSPPPPSQPIPAPAGVRPLTRQELVDALKGGRRVRVPAGANAVTLVKADAGGVWFVREDGSPVSWHELEKARTEGPQRVLATIVGG